RIRTRARAYTSKAKLREFSFENIADYEKWRELGRQAAREALDTGDFLLWIAGNHLGALPVYDEIAAGSTDTLVIHFDAHLDINEFAACTQQLSHGNFLRHIDGKTPQIINVGHRDLLLRQEDIGKYYKRHYPASALAVDPEPVLKELRAGSIAAERVIVDIDCDVFDTAYFPAAPQPVLFGMSPSLVLRFLEAVWSPRVAGVLVSEFDPSRDKDDRSLATLVWLLEWMLLKRHEKAKPDS